ncbi:hypothetical protein C491_17352 [Natronococcus amylolyticus DSM 10524]|uniref:Uncharacterized protein n=1 Tax=Natronococcus amylolyticus DSM 10524 TaxID=1227497 RepID=L9X1B9_9EURY|nr:hypothetical protein [Natronococcus amylolyticus]ELY55500.1 hypothetical protein C491_17352 [Natronococcus amylolyticus DSM 10524]
MVTTRTERAETRFAVGHRERERDGIDVMGPEDALQLGGITEALDTAVRDFPIDIEPSSVGYDGRLVVGRRRRLRLG